ncbi:MAG: SIMPL domain-containing protein [Pseudomonadota bacterium]
MGLIRLFVMWLALTGAAWGDDTARTITVTGEGSVAAAPDMAVISLGATHQDRDARVAMDRVSDDVAAIFARLEGLGIAPSDMQTDGVSLQPVWDQGYSSGQSRRISGFVASNTVTIRARDLEALGGLLNAVLEDGANRFGGLRFAVQEPKPLRDAARAAAVADALDRAGLMASAAGVTLGPIRTMREGGGHAGPVMMEMAAARSADVPIAPGELTMQAQVEVVFDLIVDQ